MVTNSIGPTKIILQGTLRRIEKRKVENVMGEQQKSGWGGNGHFRDVIAKGKLIWLERVGVELCHAFIPHGYGDELN